MSDRLDAHADALKAYLSAATKAQVLDLDEIKAMPALPSYYVELYLTKRYGGQARFDGSRDSFLRRLSTRVVADTVSNGRLIEDRISAAFEFVAVSLGDTTVRVDYETGGGNFDWDDGKYSALTDWTFGV